MQVDQESRMTLSTGVVGLVAIIAVVLMVVELTPGAIEPVTVSAPQNVGRAVDYGADCVPVGQQFNYASFDFNQDNMLNFYDYMDVLSGAADCNAMDCDLNDDGFIDSLDQELFNLLVVRVYDYNHNRIIDRDDPLFLRDVLYGDAHCTGDYVCDLNGDGLVCSDDLTIFTSLIYNYDNPDVSAQNLVGQGITTTQRLGIPNDLEESDDD